MDRGGVAAQRGSRPVLASNLTGRPHASGSRLGLTADLAESASAVVQASWPWQAALSPVSPRPARPRDAGDPPHGYGPAEHARAKAGATGTRPSFTVLSAIVIMIGCGSTPVKKIMRLQLQKFVPGVIPQPLVREGARDSTTKH